MTYKVFIGRYIGTYDKEDLEIIERLNSDLKTGEKVIIKEIV